jgi:hypothetical protein
MSAIDLAATPDGASEEAASESGIRYPFLLPASRWRRAVKVGVGRIALMMRPGRARRLLHGSDPMTFSFTDRLIIAGWVSRATPDDWPTLSDLHQRFWAGRGGAMFNTAPEIAQRFDDWFLRQHARPLDVLQAELAGHQCHALCEIGSGNGLALEYASTTIPAIPRFIGIDINAQATRRNTVRWHDHPRIEFAHADAVEWIEQNAEPGWAYFSNAGVLEYLPQDKVARLYRHTAELGGPAWWILTEPVHSDYDLATETESRPHGPEFSFCHNHPFLLRQAGWEIIERFETETAGLRFLTVCARTP